MFICACGEQETAAMDTRREKIEKSQKFRSAVLDHAGLLKPADLEHSVF